MALQNITTPQPSADPEAIKAAIIAKQNDQFRAALILGINPTVPGKVLITPSCPRREAVRQERGALRFPPLPDRPIFTEATARLTANLESHKWPTNSILMTM